MLTSCKRSSLKQKTNSQNDYAGLMLIGGNITGVVVGDWHSLGVSP